MHVATPQKSSGGGKQSPHVVGYCVATAPHPSCWMRAPHVWPVELSATVSQTVSVHVATPQKSSGGGKQAAARSRVLCRYRPTPILLDESSTRLACRAVCNSIPNSISARSNAAKVFGWGQTSSARSRVLCRYRPTPILLDESSTRLACRAVCNSIPYSISARSNAAKVFGWGQTSSAT